MTTNLIMNPKSNPSLQTDLVENARQMNTELRKMEDIPNQVGFKLRLVLLKDNGMHSEVLGIVSKDLNGCHIVIDTNRTHRRLSAFNGWLAA